MSTDGNQRPPGLSRDQMVKLITGMLRKRGAAMASELERRVESGQPLEVRGVRVDVSTLKEALGCWNAEVAGAANGTSQEPDSEVVVVNSAGRPKVEEVVVTSATAVAAVPAAKASAPAVGARWMPSAPSASLLAVRAIAECEQAEACNRTVKVVRGATIPILPKPDILTLASSTGSLKAGQNVEVIARYACPRDGRVYLRMNALQGWFSTRSEADFSKMVISALPGSLPIEPKGWSEVIGSTALEILPLVEGCSASATVGENTAGGIVDLESVEVSDDDLPLTQDTDDLPLTQDTDMTRETDCEGEEEEEEPEDDAMDELDGEEEIDAPRQKTRISIGSDGGVKSNAALDSRCTDGDASVRRERRFKVLVGRFPVLNKPCADQLMSPGQARVLQHNQVFKADGVVYVAAEGRAYVRLKGGHGWVSERSRNDIRRLAITTVTLRKGKLTKKMAKAVAFRGGDTEGRTNLRKEDLTRSKSGKIVSKRASEAAKKRYEDSGAKLWAQAIKKTRDEMGLVGFVVLKKGTPMYLRAREIYTNMKEAGTAKQSNASVS